MHISVIIPAFNEGNKIGDTIESIKKTGVVNEIIVVDDGSIDNTANIAKTKGAKVIRLNTNVGKGTALSIGLNESKSDIIVFLDADIGSTGSEITRIIDPIINGECDVAVARLANSKRKGGFGLVKLVARYGTKILTDNYIHSVLSGQRAFKSEIIKKIKLEKGYGAEVAMTIDMLNDGYTLKEYEVNMSHDETGRDLRGFIHRGRQMIDIIIVLSKRMKVKNIINKRM